MNDDSAWNMYVFREGRSRARGERLKTELHRLIGELISAPSEDSALSALIAAGELECALADSESGSIELAQSITDLLANRLMTDCEIDALSLMHQVAQINVPDVVSVSVAEGFAYYGLHPFRFREPVQPLATSAPVRVIGIRSIGTTLSAVVAALFAEHVSDVRRITVRPHGHPYDRKLELTAEQKNWVLDAENALVVIVDEGPGLSGSSFLSVAEAVESAGVDRSRIIMLGSRSPDVSQMRASNVSSRWPRFRFVTVAEEPKLPDEAQIDIGGGQWRRIFWDDFENQPSTWAHLESAKYLSGDRRSFYKFHGYGHFGRAIGERATAAAEAGFAPRSRGIFRGFGQYDIISGRHMRPGDLNREILERIAGYCAFRVCELKVEEIRSDLDAMAKWNWQCEFGNELVGLELQVERTVVADARMLPHEWIRSEGGRILKLDGSTHGDDHFFPGPCDIAWDLAGTIVEWEMSDVSAVEFLDTYRQLSGDNPQFRISEYVLAYSVFRMGWCKMAAGASRGTFDETLLIRDYLRYRNQAIRAQARRAAAHAVVAT